MRVSTPTIITIQPAGSGVTFNLVEGDRAVLDALYGCDTAAADPADLVVTYGPTLADPAAQVREVLEGANRGGGTLRLASFDGERLVIEGGFAPAPVEPDVVDVDLKWSLWSADEETFEEYAPGIAARMRAAHSGEGKPLLLRTAPRKEIRFGAVLISKGTAEVEFSFEWDEPHELAASVDDRLETGMSDEEHDWVSGLVADYLAASYCEFRRERVISEEDFGKLLEAVDKVEEELLEGEKGLSAAFDEYVASLAESVTERRNGGDEP